MPFASDLSPTLSEGATDAASAPVTATPVGGGKKKSKEADPEPESPVVGGKTPTTAAAAKGPAGKQGKSIGRQPKGKRPAAKEEAEEEEGEERKRLKTDPAAEKEEEKPALDQVIERNGQFIYISTD